MSTVPNLVLKALKIVSGSKQKFYTCNQKGLKLLVKIQLVALSDKKLRKLIVIFFNFIFFLVRENVKSDAPLGSSFPTIPNLLNLVKYLKSKADTAQKMKFSIKDFFSKCEQIRRKLRICSHLLKKSLMENFIFCAVRFVKSAQ